MVLFLLQIGTEALSWRYWGMQARDLADVNSQIWET